MKNIIVKFGFLLRKNKHLIKYQTKQPHDLREVVSYFYKYILLK